MPYVKVGAENSADIAIRRTDPGRPRDRRSDLPFESTAARRRDDNLIADLTVVEVENGHHNVGWTHPDECNAALPDFPGR